MTTPTSPGPRAVADAMPTGAAPSRARWLLALACAPLPLVALALPAAIEKGLQRVDAASKGHAQSLLLASGIPDEELASLRARLDEHALLIVFFPLDGLPADARAKLLEMLESRMQIYRNLLYPRPRDARMCASVEDAQRAAAARVGAALVVDLRQEDAASPVEGAEAVYTRVEGVRVRHWLLRGAAK